MQPAHERVGVVDTQWIRHKVIPSLGEQVNLFVLGSGLLLAHRRY